MTRRSVYDRQRAKPPSPIAAGALCTKCPLQGVSEPIYGDGPPQPTLAIVAEAPTREENNTGVPFIGRTGEYIEALLGRHGLSRHDVLLDYSIACFPPGGDLKAFIAVAKKAWKAEGREFTSPIDCCLPRLMRSLGVPQCKKCQGWKLSITTHPSKCVCPKPMFVALKDRPPVKAVLALGNGPLTALDGHGGIMKKQMYVFGEKEK